ncbi:MAG: DUF2189 domain-containing protein [Candidatus Thiodiazotropha lotti]|uniref:DUF2189 domain-containing protein n=1 Tax=Candidatus Thiodiazotropha lotti TaxID=2792787 RepID=A0A9E4K6R9_9GAMM|nr:DUF2189 domain-containing protein [Candidatus Thiodiazotropha lotti]MCW4204582.1 DUF2189 domain-containing protein [Candidatus Thiodiazotropha lotti]ODC01442.1 hypothetical protein A3197_02900 [Candidatus Thiodiazotropha endoloripes]
MNHAVIHHYDDQPVTIAEVKEINSEQPWKWLSAGWQDIKTAPFKSLSYGLALTAISYLLMLLIITNESYFLLPQLLAGFFLVAPLLGIGLYAFSRQIESGNSPSFKQAADSIKDNYFNIFSMGLILVVALIAWVTLAHLIIALTFTGITPATWQGFLVTLFGTWNGFQLLVAGTVSGAVIAFMIFSISAISVPMLLDRNCNAFDAIQTSWSAMRHNRMQLLLWGGILVAIIIAGFLTMFVGLIIGFPLAAHATWHAYSDLVVRETPA